MNKKEFIAEITSDLKQYDESGLIDYRSLDLWIRNGIKRFGNNVMIPTDTVLKVENGRAKLPEGFWKLDLAVKCDPDGYKVETGDVKSVVMSHTFKTRIEQDYEWNNMSESYIGKNYKQITEKVFIDNNIVNFYYKAPTVLRLTKGMKKENCTSTCANLQKSLTYSSPWEINILNNTIQTNFTKGYIYIQYLSFPVDENGDLIIPETQHNHLQEYLMYHCKSKILENLMGNGDETNLVNMYNLYSRKEREYFSLAMTEVKFESLGHDWDKKMRNKMRINTNKIENLFPGR